MTPRSDLELRVMAMTEDYMDEWISATPDLAVWEEDIVRAYLEARSTYIDKINAMVVMFIQHDSSKTRKPGACL